MNRLFALLLFGISVSVFAQPPMHCGDLSQQAPASRAAYLKGIQYGWENATGIFLTEMNRHIPPDSKGTPKNQTDWVDSYVLPSGVEWIKLIDQVAEECKDYPESLVFIVAHRISVRARVKTKTDPEKDRLLDIASVRCNGLNTLNTIFFDGYRDGFNALIESEKTFLNKIDDPATKQVVSTLDRIATQQSQRASSLDMVSAYCQKEQNKNQPLVFAFMSTPDETQTKTEWQTGTLIDTTARKGTRLYGSFNDSHGMIVEKRDDATFYKIESDEYIYLAKRTLTKRWDKQLQVTINGPVKFRIKGSDFFLIADDGKEHKLSLEKKILKTSK